MSDTQLVTRDQMADLLVGQWNSGILEPIRHNWKRVNTTVVRQGDTQITNAIIDFHMFELGRQGSHHMTFDIAAEPGSDRTAQFVPGSLTYIQPNAITTQSSEGDAELQQIYIDRSVFSECASSLFKGDPDRVNSLAFYGIFDPAMKANAEAILEEARNPQIGTDLNVDLLAQQLALLVLRRQNGPRLLTPTTRPLSPDEIARVISYFEDQIEDIGGMDTVAGLVNMDVYSFTRAFKETTGQTPGQFLIQRRLMRVKDLLLGTKDTLADITYATGFSNQAHMTSTFSKHVGISPGRWRKAVRT